MKKSLAAIILLCLVGTAAADETANHEFLYGFLAGTYRAVGKEADSDRTYSGKVILKNRSDHLAVTRTIGSETVTGTGTIEHALGPDEAHVLRVRFTRNGKDYEITYLWRSDLDNFARLSGYLYEPGGQTGNPGLEALFIDPAAR